MLGVYPLWNMGELFSKLELEALENAFKIKPWHSSKRIRKSKYENKGNVIFLEERSAQTGNLAWIPPCLSSPFEVRWLDEIFLRNLEGKSLIFQQGHFAMTSQVMQKVQKTMKKKRMKTTKKGLVRNTGETGQLSRHINCTSLNGPSRSLTTPTCTAAKSWQPGSTCLKSGFRLEWSHLIAGNPN